MQRNGYIYFMLFTTHKHTHTSPTLYLSLTLISLCPFSKPIRLIERHVRQQKWLLPSTIICSSYMTSVWCTCFFYSWCVCLCFIHIFLCFLINSAGYKKNSWIHTEREKRGKGERERKQNRVKMQLKTGKMSNCQLFAIFRMSNVTDNESKISIYSFNLMSTTKKKWNIFFSLCVSVSMLCGWML